MRSTRVVLGVIVGGAVIARFATLDQQSFTFDEALTVRLAEMDLGSMLADLREGERNPPLYYVLAWLWARIAGTEEIALRSLSAAFGTATIPVAFLAARRLLPNAGSVVAAVLVAVNPLLFWYSQEARAYALYALLTAASLLFYARLLRGSSPRDRWAWAVSSAAALGTHYFSIFLVVPQAAWLLWRGRIRARHVGVPAAVMLALTPLALAQDAGSGQYPEGDEGQRLVSIVKQLLVGLELDTPAEAALKVAGVVALAVAVGAWWRATRLERAGIDVPAALAGASLVVPFALATVGFDYLNSRNVLGVVVPMTIALGGAYAVRRAQPLAGLAAVLMALAAVTSVALTLTDTFPQRENWRGLARAVGGYRHALVITPGEGKPYDAYPLRPYLDRVVRLPATGACVDEAAVAALPVRGGRKVSWASIGSRHLEAPTIPKLRLTERVVDETFVLYRYRASTPWRATPRRLLPFRRDTNAHGAVLLLGRRGPGCPR